MRILKVAAVFCCTALLAASSALSCFAKAGDNIMNGASLYQCTGYINSDEQAAYLFDGEYDTKWCATADITDYSGYDFAAQAGKGYIHILGVDFGASKYFDSYRLYLASTGARDSGITDYNASAWVIQLSDDGEVWIDVSRVTENYNDEVVTVNIGVRQARYLRILIDGPELTGGSTVRLYELEVYECDPGTVATGVVRTNGSNVNSEDAGETKVPLTDAGDEVETEYSPAEAIIYEGYQLGTNGVAAVITLALIAATVAFFAARKAGKDRIYH